MLSSHLLIFYYPICCCCCPLALHPPPDQDLAKEHGVRANQKTERLIVELSALLNPLVSNYFADLKQTTADSDPVEVPLVPGRLAGVDGDTFPVDQAAGTGSDADSAPVAPLSSDTEADAATPSSLSVPEDVEVEAQPPSEVMEEEAPPAEAMEAEAPNLEVMKADSAPGVSAEAGLIASSELEVPEAKDTPTPAGRTSGSKRGDAPPSEAPPSAEGSATKKSKKAMPLPRGEPWAPPRWSHCLGSSAYVSPHYSNRIRHAAEVPLHMPT